MSPLNGFPNRVCVHLPVSDLRFGKRHHHELGCKTHMCQLYLRQTFLSVSWPGDRRVPGLARPPWASAGALGARGASSTFHSRQGGGPRVLEPRGWAHTLSADLPVTRHPAPLGRKAPGLRVSSQFSWVSVPHTWGCFPCSDLCGFLFPMHVPSSNPQQGGGHPG